MPTMIPFPLPYSNLNLEKEYGIHIFPGYKTKNKNSFTTLHIILIPTYIKRAC